MTRIASPATPTVAIARELRRLGLNQGRDKDFTVAGYRRNGERLHTYVVLNNQTARRIVAEHADDLEERTGAGPFPFMVSIGYSTAGHPHPSIRNGHHERVREAAPAVAPAAPAVEEPAAVEPAAPAPAPAADVDAPAADEAPAVEPAATAPAVDMRDEHRQEEQAAGLRWSTRHADLVTWAAAGHLVFDAAGVLRHVTAAGRTGRRIAAGPLHALADGWFLVVGDPDDAGRRHVTPTVDGRRALLVWERVRPEPVELPRNRWREPLRPLRGGEEQRRRSRAFWVEEEERVAARAQWLVEWEKRVAAEEFEERLRQAWARVEGVALTVAWRKRPAGWAPTDEEAAWHNLDADVVAALRAEARVLDVAAA
jgi:hypothetical protein